MILDDRQGPLPPDSRYSAAIRPAEGLDGRDDPAVLRVYAIKCAMHYHVHRLIDALQRRTTSVLNTF